MSEHHERSLFHPWMLPAVLYCCGLLCIAIQPLRLLLHPAYKGLLPYITTDHLYYALRVQEALIGGDATNGIFSLGAIPGLQPAGLETLTGFLVGWMYLSVAVIVPWVTVIIAPLSLPFGYLVFRQCGSSRCIATVCSLLFFWIHLMSLMRYVHQSWSFPCFLLGLILLVRWWQYPHALSAFFAGIWVGLMTTVYFWNWTFLGAFITCLTLCTVFTRACEARAGHRRTVIWIWLGFALFFVPYVIRMFSLSHSQYFDEASIRSALLMTSEIESWPRSILLFIVAIFCGSTVIRRALPQHRVPLLVFCATPILVFHQQWIHGRVVSFSTHYMPFIAFSVLVLIAWTVSSLRTIRSYGWMGCIAGIVLLAPLIKDYSPRLTLFRVDNPTLFSFQHLAPVIQLLSTDPTKETILTDQETALYVASHTNDDVVFVEFARHLLLSTAEYAERYCVSELPTSPRVDGSWVSERLQELSAIGHKQIADTYRKNSRIAMQACCAVQRDPASFLQKFGVTAVLINERSHPTWRLDASQFTLLHRGDGWSLWRLHRTLRDIEAVRRRERAYASCSTVERNEKDVML